MPLLARGYERLLISHLRQRKREYYKTTLFVILGLLAFILGFALVWRGPAPAPIEDATNSNIGLFVDDPSVNDAVLEVAYVPQEDSTLVYIRPAFKIADDRTVHWAILVGGVQIDVSPVTAFDKDFASRGYLLPGYRTVRQARPGPDRTLQMFSGVTTGPIDGISAVQHFVLGPGTFFIAADTEHPQTEAVSGVIPPVAVEHGGHLTARLPLLSATSWGGSFSLDPQGRMTTLEDALESGRYDGFNPTWNTVTNAQVHVELHRDLNGWRLDSVLPPPVASNIFGVAWEGQSVRFPDVEATDLAAESASHAREFSAGILIALGASAILAALQEPSHASAKMLTGLRTSLRSMFPKSQAARARGHDPVGTRAVSRHKSNWVVSPRAPRYPSAITVVSLAFGLGLFLLGRADLSIYSPEWLAPALGFMETVSNSPTEALESLFGLVGRVAGSLIFVALCYLIVATISEALFRRIGARGKSSAFPGILPAMRLARRSAQLASELGDEGAWDSRRVRSPTVPEVTLGRTRWVATGMVVGIVSVWSAPQLLVLAMVAQATLLLTWRPKATD